MLSSIDIKKQIIQESDISGIRRRTENLIDVNQEQALIEQADALERLTSEKGWIFLEAYMMKVIMGSLLEEKDRELSKGMINVMQYIAQLIKVRDGIFERRKEREVA